MKYIFGLGLPRTGTNSLSEALFTMGINGECKCILNNYHKKREEFYDNETQRYIIYNDAYKHLDILLNSDKIHDNKYILTIRDDHTWKHSLKKFNVEELYSFDMEKYKKDIFEIFEKNNCIENLLILNIFENSDDILWKKLSNFLGLECPTKTFPIINLNTV